MWTPDRPNDNDYVIKETQRLVMVVASRHAHDSEMHFFKLTCRCADHDQVDTQQLVQTMSNIGRRKMLRYQRRARGKSSKTNDSVTHEMPKIKKECPRFIISRPGNKRAKIKASLRGNGFCFSTNAWALHSYFRQTNWRN